MKKVFEIALGIVTSIGGFLEIGSITTAAQGGALTPDERKLYTANGISNDVSVIDTATNTVVKTIKAGDGPWGIAIKP